MQLSLILGSSSVFRQRVLSEAGIAFEVASPDIDEKSIRKATAHDLTRAIAEAKSVALQERVNKPAILITSDQVVVCNGSIREKPIDQGEAREFLRSYSQYPAQTVTAVYVHNTVTKESLCDVDVAGVRFAPIPESVIDQLLEFDLFMKSAGAFVVEHPLLSPYVQSLEGTIDSIQGLPLEMTKTLVRKLGGEALLSN